MRDPIKPLTRFCYRDIIRTFMTDISNELLQGMSAEEKSREIEKRHTRVSSTIQADKVAPG